MEPDQSLTREAILDALHEVVSGLQESAEISWRGSIVELDAATRLSDIGLDSLEWATILLELEERIGGEVHDTDLGKVQNLGQLLDLVAAKAGPADP